MEAWLSATRAVHFAAAVALFGQFVFTFLLSPGRARASNFDAVAKWSAGVAVASALAWLMLEAVNMSGLPLGEAIEPETLATVATKTLFGRVWLARMAVLAVLVIVVLAMRRPTGQRGNMALDAVGLTASLAFLASIAAMGHAQDGRGSDRVAHLFADGIHLLAAGAWLGALPPLIRTLGDAMREPQGAPWVRATSATRRFSEFGIASVGTIVLTGIVNVTYTIHGLPALWQSAYGRMLVAKLLVFAAIVGIAAVNRFRLTPRMVDPSNAPGMTAMRVLRRNAIIEAVLGLAILAIVGKLGITMPMHHA